MDKETVDLVIRQINEYADKVLGDIDPQKTKISVQLKAIRPEMERLAKQHNIDVEDLFIIYMDRCSEVFANQEQSFQDMMKFL